jgi:hypothetical protein
MQRALRYDGILPTVIGEDGMARAAKPDEVRALKAFTDANRVESAPFDIVVEGETPGDYPDKASAKVREWANVGATWWIEASWMAPDLEHVLARIKQGPPLLN